MDKITNYSSPFQSLYSHHYSYSITFPPNSRWTKQSFKDECDINTIMGRYLATGEMPNLVERAPQYLDASTGFDFQEMQNKVIEARQLFDELPSALRTRFANDPAAFLNYVGDPANHNEMRELGLMRTPSLPIDTRSVDPEPAAPPKEN